MGVRESERRVGRDRGIKTFQIKLTMYTIMTIDQKMKPAKDNKKAILVVHFVITSPLYQGTIKTVHSDLQLCCTR